MAIRIRVGNVTLEVDSEADLRVALAALNAVPAKSGDASRLARKQSSGDPLTDVLRALPSNQKRLLWVLAGSQSDVSDAELRKALAIATNNALAGVTAGIAKNAKRANLEFSDIVVKEQRTNGTGERAYFYRLTPSARERLPSKPGRRTKESR